MQGELAVAAKTFVSAIARQHDLAVLACSPTNRESRKHRRISEGLVVVINKIVKDVEQFFRGEPHFMVIRLTALGDLPGVRRLVKFFVVEGSAESRQ